MTAEALGRLAVWPRERLASLPTPLVKAKRLGSYLGVDELYVKMDSETGFALGGNKVRKLEFELAPDRLDGVSCLITAGGPQSNHCRVTAAFAARAGIRCILVTQGPEASVPTGNALLHRLFGAEIVTVEDRDERAPTMDSVASAVSAQGGHPLVVPIGASTGLGCLGYALAAAELAAQLDEAGAAPESTWLFVSTSSCGTVAGLALGLALLGRTDIRIVGVSADASAERLLAETGRIAAEGAALLGCDVSIPHDAVAAVDDQVGGGYGIPTPESESAMADFGRLEGIVLDPTYTAKAAAGMIDWIRTREPAPGERVVFLHTGGHPGLFT